MQKITLYILRYLIFSTLLISFSLVCVIWLTQSLRFLDMIVNRGVEISTFLYLTVLLLPSLFVVVLPIALFAAVVFTYNRLFMDGELIIFQSSGLSPMDVARPALILGAVFTLVGYALTLYILPISYQKFKGLQYKIRHDYSMTLLEEGVFSTLNKGLTVYVQERKRDGELRHILVHDERNPNQQVTIIAKKGAFLMTPNGPQVQVAEGNRQELNLKTGKLSILYFDQYEVDLAQFDEAPAERWRDPKEWFLGELLSPDHEKFDLTQRNKLYAEAHQRLTSPLYHLVFAMVGTSILLLGNFSRRGQTKRILVAIGVTVVIQATSLGFVNVAGGDPQFVFLMYLNILIPLVVGWQWLKNPQLYRVFVKKLKGWMA